MRRLLTTARLANVDTRAALLFHNDAIVMAEQLAVRSQTQYKQEYLSTLYTADTLYGVQVYRPEAGFVLAVLLPNRTTGVAMAPFPFSC